MRGMCEGRVPAGAVAGTRAAGAARPNAADAGASAEPAESSP